MIAEDDKLLTIRDRIRAEFGTSLTRIILFGSRARGDATPESDYDFLLVFDSITPDIGRRLDDLTFELLWDLGVVVSAFPTTDAVLRDRPYEPFLINAQREGVAL